MRLYILDMLVFIFLSLVLLLPHALMLIRWRSDKLRIAANMLSAIINCDQEPQLEGSKWLGEEERRGDEVMMMEMNDANTRQMFAAAYDQATPHGRIC